MGRNKIANRWAEMRHPPSTADINTMAKSIKDRYFKVLAPRSDKVEQLLEEILPSDKVPRAPSIIQSVQEEEVLTEADQGVIAELFDTLETVHDQLATACGLLGRLSQTLKLSQQMIVIKASIRSLIQLNTTVGLDIATTTNKTPELPDDQAEWVKLMIVPDPEASLLKKEKKQPYQTAHSHLRVQNHKQVWEWNDTTKDAGVIPRKSKTAGGMYNWEKVFRWNGLKVHSKEAQSPG